MDNLVKEKVCLEIGSSKLRAIVAKEGVNNTLFVKELACRDYDGYFQGEFIDFSHLGPNLYDLFNSIDFKKKKYNKKLFIALPAEMTKVINVVVGIDVEGIKKITKNDLEGLKLQAIQKIKNDENEIISVSALSYKVDEVQVENPIGQKGRNLSGEFSIILCDKNLIEKFNTIFSDIGFSNVEYVSEALCQALFIVPVEERKEGAILIDVGHLSTSISYIKNQGLLSLTSFSIGGGHVTSDLSEAFELAYEDADRLKKMVVLSVEPDALDYYDLPSIQGKIERIPQGYANEVVSYRLETIASAINQCLLMQNISLINYLPVYLCGAGASKIKGGKDFIAKCLGRNIILGITPLPGKDKPEDSVIYSIANYAIKNCE